MDNSIAYFSMEIALDPAIPTYSGGLGVLAGDTLRAAADRNLPMIAVTLMYRCGYFVQTLRAWQYDVRGTSGGVIPVYLLDTDLPENTEWDRQLTENLYGGDQWYRLCQEIVLGMGGVRMLRALGYHEIIRFHMNEGHAALLSIELLSERAHWFGRETFNPSRRALLRWSVECDLPRAQSQPLRKRCCQKTW